MTLDGNRIGLTLVCGMIFAMAAMAQEPGGPPPGGAGGRGERGERGQRPPKPPIDTALDTSGDGVIDASEIAGASTALKSLDKNGDGQLTRDECLPSRPGGEGGSGGPGGRGGQKGLGGKGGPGGNRPAPPIFTALDADGDGVISASEIATAPASLKKLDQDGDGRLSPDEYRPPRPGGGDGDKAPI
jgi:hypothetical protein